jgi:hypothetical protein
LRLCWKPQVTTPLRLCDTKVNKILKTEKGLWDWWHPQWVSQAPTTKTISSPCTFIQPMVSILDILQRLARNQKLYRYRNPERTQHFLKIYVRLASCPRQAMKMFFLE